MAIKRHTVAIVAFGTALKIIGKGPPAIAVETVHVPRPYKNSQSKGVSWRLTLKVNGSAD